MYMDCCGTGLFRTMLLPNWCCPSHSPASAGRGCPRSAANMKRSPATNRKAFLPPPSDGFSLQSIAAQHRSTFKQMAQLRATSATGEYAPRRGVSVSVDCQRLLKPYLKPQHWEASLVPGTLSHVS